MQFGMFGPMGGGFGGNFGGGKGGKNTWYQPNCSTKAYVDRQLKPDDVEGYVGAALVPYRKVDGAVELLLSYEKCWNVFTNKFDDVAWNTVGGKRIFRSERLPDTTAIRNFLDGVGDEAGAPSADEVFNMSSNAFVAWYPTGKYVFVFFQVLEDSFAELPTKFAEAKASRPDGQDEFTLTHDGYKKWTKQIEAFEWVATSDLVPEPKKDCSDLLKNLLQFSELAEFFKGTSDHDAELPAVDVSARALAHTGKGPAKAEGAKASKGKGKSKGKDKGKGGKNNGGGKGYDGYGGGKGYDGGYGFLGGGMPMGMPMGPPSLPFAPMHQAPMPPPPPAGSGDMELQLYGEQLYCLIQPLVPNPYAAQKITGMLLELPRSELVQNLTNREELERRVREAMLLLKDDGVV